MEVNVGILCSCLPTLKGLLSRFYPSAFGTTLYSSARRSVPIEIQDISSRTPEPHELEVGIPTKELSVEEKRSSRSDVDKEVDDNRPSSETHPRYDGGQTFYQYNHPRRFGERDFGKRDDETVSSEGGSINRLAPMQRLYQHV